jgi:hypothetical protein
MNTVDDLVKLWEQQRIEYMNKVAAKEPKFVVSVTTSKEVLTPEQVYKVIGLKFTVEGSHWEYIVNGNNGKCIIKPNSVRPATEEEIALFKIKSEIWKP